MPAVDGSASSARLLHLKTSTLHSHGTTSREMAAAKPEDDAAHPSSRDVSSDGVSTESDDAADAHSSADAAEFATLETETDSNVRPRPQRTTPIFRKTRSFDSEATESDGCSSNRTMRTHCHSKGLLNCYTCHIRGLPATRGRGRRGPRSRRSNTVHSSGVMLMKQSSTCRACGEDSLLSEGMEFVRVGGNAWRAATEEGEFCTDPQSEGLGGPFRGGATEHGPQRAVGSCRRRKRGQRGKSPLPAEGPINDGHATQSVGHPPRPMSAEASPERANCNSKARGSKKKTTDPLEQKY